MWVTPENVTDMAVELLALDLRSISPKCHKTFDVWQFNLHESLSQYLR